MSKAMEPDLQTPLGRTSGQTAKKWSHPSNHWLRGFVLDQQDAEHEHAVAALGLSTVVTQTVMLTLADRTQLAADVLRFIKRIK